MHSSLVLSLEYTFKNKGDKFLKKLWCCVGGEYYKIIWFYHWTGLIMWIDHREDIRISLRWPIHIINPVDKTKSHLWIIAITIFHRETEITYGGWYLAKYTYVWIYENGAKELNRGLSGRFFSPEKVDDIKIKWEVSPFFLSLPVYLPFIALLSLFFRGLFTWLEEGLKV